MSGETGVGDYLLDLTLRRCGVYAGSTGLLLGLQDVMVVDALHPISSQAIHVIWKSLVLPVSLHFRTSDRYAHMVFHSRNGVMGKLSSAALLKP